MQWEQLLSSKRLNVSDASVSQDTRSPYLIDVDRLIYSAHFRKLQDKTQVHPLSQSDFVRTRLTHSLEVATVARSLGYNIGLHILKNNPQLSLTEHDFGYIVQAASLAHDIGNPPFGHLGEDAIKDFYNNYLQSNTKDNFSEAQENDLKSFDGNSQGFRIITNLAGWKSEGGLRLTYATLGAFLKYPRSYASYSNLLDIFNNNKANLITEENYKLFIGHKKIGVLDTEINILKEVATELGLKKLSNNYEVYYRHPMAFLTEAADDICYSIADIEDAFFVGLIKLEDVEDLLIPIVRPNSKYNNISKTEKLLSLKNEDFYKQMDLRKKVEFLRGKAINNLISATVNAFITYEKDILDAKFSDELLNKTEFAKEIKECKNFVRNFVFKSHKKINAEISGITIIYETINELSKLIFNPESSKSYLVFNYLEKNFILDNAASIFKNPLLSNYHKFILINDIIADFTDKNIIQFYKILKGL